MPSNDEARRRFLQCSLAIAGAALVPSLRPAAAAPRTAPSASRDSSRVNDTDLTSAAALGRAYASGRLDPIEVLDRCLSRAADTQHVFIALTAERARAEAEASAQRWRRGKPLSPLDGVPVAWKDLFDVRGTVTTAGAAVFASHPPAAADAALVERATRAGLVCVGKTNLVEFAFSGLGLNPHYGTPRNPHDTHTARVPGGSSSGSAIAVALGVVPIAMGTDTAGSVRIPAAFNGLVGFKSSGAHYPGAGVFPLSRSLDSLGPIARSVEDCALIDAVLHGRPEPVAPASLQGQVFVVDEAFVDDERVQPAVRERLTEALKRLGERGARVERRRVDALHETQALIQRLGWMAAPEALAVHEALLATPDAERLDPRVRKRLESAREFRALDYVKLQWARERLIGQIRSELDGAILVLPTVAHVAPELAPLEADMDLFFKVNLATLRLTMLGSFLDMPGVALPSGVDGQGLPTSLLVCAPRGDDGRVLSVALAAEGVVAG